MNITSAISKITSGLSLKESEMSDVMLYLLEGKATDAQIGAFLIALDMKGETVEEVLGAAKIMRKLSAKVEVNKDKLVDTCGTGGSGIGIFNVSTTAAFVACACGARVAKHGNRSATRKSGSADLLEAAGVSLELNPFQVSDCIENVGLGFMFAPGHHSAMKHVIGPRKEIAHKSIFNILGPLTNPASTPNLHESQAYNTNRHDKGGSFLHPQQHHDRANRSIMPPRPTDGQRSLARRHKPKRRAIEMVSIAFAAQGVAS